MTAPTAPTDSTVPPASMRHRPSARLLVLDPEGHVLLFRFVHKTGPMAGQDFWATPGGGVEDGESFAEAAIRELREETRIVVREIGPAIASRDFELLLPDGERVWAQERFFVVRVADRRLSREGWTALEQEVMADHRWWSAEELASTTETVWPERLADLLRTVGSP